MDRQNSQENSPGEPLSGSRTRLVRDEPQAQSWRRRIRRTNHVEESLDSALPTVSSERRPHPMRSLPARPISRHITTLVSAQNSTGTSSNSSNPGQVSQIPSQNSSQSRPTESHQSSSDGLHLSLVFDQKSESNSSIDAENRYAEPNVGRQASVGSEESGANSNAVTTATNGTSSSGWTTASTVRLAHRWTTVHRRSSRLTDLLPPEERHSSGLQAPTRLLVTDPNDRVRLQSDLQSNYESVDQSKGEDDQDEDQNDSAGDRSRLVYRPPEIIYTPNRRRSSSLAPPDAEAFILGRKRYVRSFVSLNYSNSSLSVDARVLFVLPPSPDYL